MCEQIQTVGQSCLDAPIGALNEEKMHEMDLALRRSLGLEH